MTRPTQTNPTKQTGVVSPQERRHITLLSEKSDILTHNLANANLAYSEELKNLADLSLGNDSTIFDTSKSVTEALKEQLSVIDDVEKELDLISRSIRDQLDAVEALTAEGQTNIQNAIDFTSRVRPTINDIRVRAKRIRYRVNRLDNWLFKTFLQED